MASLIQVKTDYLEIIGEDNLRYSIRNDDLASTDNLYGRTISKWIRQLLQKKWAENTLLYQIAQIIVELHPENTIDWISTFYMVERKDYLYKAFLLKKGLEKTPASVDNDFISYLEFAHNPLFDEEILNIVRRNLKQYQILKP